MTKEDKIQRAFNDMYEMRALNPALADRVLNGLKKDNEITRAMRQGAAQMERDMEALDKGKVDIWDKSMPPEIEYDGLDDLDISLD